MQDHELYRRILGIEAPWQVERVELKLSQGEVHVYLAHQNQPEWACAECGALGPLYDHQPEREDRKSTRLNSSHVEISYAVFCLKKKKYKVRLHGDNFSHGYTGYRSIIRR